jgi:hypothetical protein
MLRERESLPPRAGMAFKKALGLALLCSFSVYFIPIVGPHAIFTIGESLGQHFHAFGKYPAWALTELGATLLLQLAAFVLFAWFWRRCSALRLTVLLVCAAAALVEAQELYFAAIPARFLIEPETAPEKTGAWPEACHITDGQVMNVRMPGRMPQTGWGEAWLEDSHAGWSILRMPDCQRIAAALPQPTVRPGGGVDFMINVTQVSPGGLALVQRHETATNKDTWLLANVADGTLTPLPAPQTTQYVAPYLAEDGTHTGWILVIPNTGPPVLEELHVLPVRGNAPERVVDLTPFGPNTYELIGLDESSGESFYWVSQPLPGHLLALGPDGRQGPAPAIPAGIRPQRPTIILLEHGVVAWDAYQEDENYAIAWALDTGSGSHKLPKGSSPTSVAVDPTGRYIAFSTTTTLNIGNTRDTVVVLRSVDGEAVFRRYLPAYNRSGVIFLGNAYFAYSDSGTTHVLRLP